MEYTLKDLLDIPKLRKLLDSLDEIHSMPSAIIDTDGNILTATAWQDICTKFHRVNPETEKKCIESDTHIKAELDGTTAHVIYRCPMGLVDIATPIIIEGKHLGNVFTGQLFIDPPDEAFFVDQAHKYGFDESEYLAAMRKVPFYTEQQLHSNLTFMHGLAQMLVEQGLKTKRLLEAEEKLKDANDFLLVAQQSADLGLWDWDMATGRLRWSPELFRMFGLEPSTVNPTFDIWQSVLHPDDLLMAESKIREAILDQKPLTNEYRIVTPSGEIRWIHALGQAIYDETGKPLRMAGVCSNITESKLKEEKILNSEERHRTILQTAMDGIWLVDTRGHLIEVNDAYCRMSGYNAHELLKMRISDLDSCETDDEVAARMQGITATGKSRFITKHRRKNGTVFDVEISVQYREDGGGRVVAFLRDITDQIQAEKALRVSERNYRQLFQNNPAGFALHEIILNDEGKPYDYRFLEINPAFEKLTGLKAVDLIGKTQLEVMTNSEPYWAETYGEVALTGKPISFENFSGELNKYYQVNAYAPDPHKFATVFVDITERKLAEEALLKARTLHAETEKIGKVGGWEFDIDTMEQTWTEEVYRIHEVDMTFKPTVEKGISFYTPASRPIIEKAVQRAIEYGEQFDMDLEIVTAKGNLRYVNAVGKADIENRKIVGFFQDITARKQAEIELAKSQLLLKSSIESQKDTILLSIDNNYRYLFFNKTHSDVMKHTYKTDVAVGLNILECITSNEDRVAEKENYDRALRGESHSNIRAYGEQEPIYFESFFNPILNENNEIIGATALARDITKRIQAEQEKTKLENQLQQAQKMESVGRLAGGVAHDFNNMLSVILGHAELGLMHLDPAHPVTADLKEISKTVERSAELTRQLLAFARKQTIAPKVIDLNETVAGMLKMLQRLIGEDINLTWKPASTLWPVKMDAAQLDQILANLCVNARDAIADIGKIAIETQNFTIDKNYCLNHPDVMSGDYVRLTVSDDGCGIDKETLDHIFEPFYTTKEVGKGTGLGLATVYGAVRQNNGFVNVYSEPGTGTTFTVYLPRHEGKAGHVQQEGTAESTPKGNETVLLVEDELAILKITAAILKNIGYKVLSANTPGEAMQLAREHAGDIHLLMTDIVMPEMNGRDLAKNLLSIYPGMKRLFMSGYTADVIAHHGVLDDGVHFIQKPFNLNLLAGKLREVLDN